MSLLRPMLAVFAILILLFAAFEVVENLWLADVDPELLRLLHQARGIAVGAVTAGLGSWVIVREGPQLLAAGPLPGDTTHVADETSRHLHHARWFILMRWIAVVVATVAVIGSVEVARLLPPVVGAPLGALIVLLTLLNLAYSVYLRHVGADATFLAAQVYGDIIVLILLLHFSGGIENPLTPLLLLHVIIAGIVLGRGHAYRVALFGSALFTLMAWAEYARLIPHYTLQLFPHFHVGGIITHAAHDPRYALSRVLLQAAILLLVAYFTTTLVERIRQDEGELEARARDALGQAQRLERALLEQQAAQARVVQAERLAAVGELAGQVAHEVNNPIAIISAKSRLLLRDGATALPERTAQEIGKIAELADRVARIAQGLLSYCRPAPGARAPLDVRLPVRRALTYVEVRARESGVRISDELPDNLPAVPANASELEQVFLNLFLNALDAMPAGGSLCVRAAAADGTVAVQVTDTGTGVAADIRTRVFEPFLTTKGGKGSGLGLSICQGLLRSHGGDIALESEPGCGCRVTVTLPVAARPRDSAAPAGMEAGVA
ncbi:MAG TPA: ATP-binding protein [Longimicrobiales bacterium]|nr:ATP-binding protein [Longimicrobiales bacterium]